MCGGGPSPPPVQERNYAAEEAAAKAKADQEANEVANRDKAKKNRNKKRNSLLTSGEMGSNDGSLLGG